MRLGCRPRPRRLARRLAAAGQEEGEKGAGVRGCAGAPVARQRGDGPARRRAPELACSASAQPGLSFATRRSVMGMSLGGLSLLLNGTD